MFPQETLVEVAYQRLFIWTGVSASPMANVFKSMMPGGEENAAAGGAGGGGGDAPWWLKYAGKVAGVGAGIGKWGIVAQISIVGNKIS